MYEATVVRFVHKHIKPHVLQSHRSSISSLSKDTSLLMIQRTNSNKKEQKQKIRSINKKIWISKLPAVVRPVWLHALPLSSFSFDYTPGINPLLLRLTKRKEGKEEDERK